MKRFLLVAALGLALTGCANGKFVGATPKTPNEALVSMYTALGSLAASFNAYASQRPFCDQPGAKPPPLCADRQIVIKGDQMAIQVADALGRAEAVVKATSIADDQWKAIADVTRLMDEFKSFVGLVGVK